MYVFLVFVAILCEMEENGGNLRGLVGISGNSGFWWEMMGNSGGLREMSEECCGMVENGRNGGSCWGMVGNDGQRFATVAKRRGSYRGFRFRRPSPPPLSVTCGIGSKMGPPPLISRLRLGFIASVRSNVWVVIVCILSRILSGLFFATVFLKI